MKLIRTYFAEAAHQLTHGVPDGHPCKRLHGHRYEIAVYIAGGVDPKTGMVMEYDEIDRRVNEVLCLVDHRFTNMLGTDVRVGTDPTTAFPVLICGPIEGANIHEEVLAAKVRENSTVEHLKAWFIAELQHRFADSGASVWEVEMKEDPRSSVTA